MTHMSIEHFSNYDQYAVRFNGSYWWTRPQACMEADMRADMCAGMCVDTHAGTRIDMCVATRAGTRIGMCVDTCAGTRIGMRVDTRVGVCGAMPVDTHTDKTRSFQTHKPHICVTLKLRCFALVEGFRLGRHCAVCSDDRFGPHPPYPYPLPPFKPPQSQRTIPAVGDAVGRRRRAGGMAG